MIRTFILVGLLGAMLYCAAAAPVRAHEAGGYAIAARADWRAQRRLLPGSLVAHNATAHELEVAARAAAAEPHA